METLHLGTRVAQQQTSDCGIEATRQKTYASWFLQRKRLVNGIGEGTESAPGGTASTTALLSIHNRKKRQVQALTAVVMTGSSTRLIT
jgi:hypothetical protein